VVATVGRMLPIRVDPASTTAPFEQIRTQVAALVAQRDLAPGTRLPTVRQLATDLGLAVNTVARAYRELEADGVVATYGRKGSFVRSEVVDASPDASPGREARDRARSAAEAYVASVRALGLDVAEATRLVELAWAHG
jgi:DNA-binding transcriptional regulator YhcF (GntR family)